MQLCLNTKQNFESSCNLIVGEKLLLVVKSVLRFSVSKPLDFHDITFSDLLRVFEV